MSGHGNGADGDAIVLSVLLGILVGLACWSWRFVRAMAASAIASSRSITAVGARHGVGFRSLHEALDITSPQRYLGTLCRAGRASQGLRRTPQKPRNCATRCLIPTEIPRTKRHTPIHLLCVLKARRTAGQQRRCA